MSGKPENYDEIRADVEKVCPSCNTQLVAFDNQWYEAQLQDKSMLMLPVKRHTGCMGLIDLGMPPTSANVWNLVWNPHEMLDLSIHLFFAFGPGSPDRRDDNSWVQINSEGECNRDVRLSSQQANELFMALYGWTQGNAESKNFSLCSCASIEIECEPGFCGVEFIQEQKGCPFATVFDTMSRKWCDCYTVMCEGICFYDLLDLFAEEGADPNEDFRFQMWANCMLMFVSKFMGV